MSGKTVQIRSTDAEGRLVLSDGVYYGDTTYNPVLLVDLATLTGSARRALGGDYAALFARSQHDELAAKLKAMGKVTGDEVWQLPLNKNHFKAIENNVADVMNSGPSAPGASAGGGGGGVRPSLAPLSARQQTGFIWILPGLHILTRQRPQRHHQALGLLVSAC